MISPISGMTVLSRQNRNIRYLKIEPKLRLRFEIIVLSKWKSGTKLSLKEHITKSNMKITLKNMLRDYALSKQS